MFQEKRNTPVGVVPGTTRDPASFVRLDGRHDVLYGYRRLLAGVEEQLLEGRIDVSSPDRTATPSSRFVVDGDSPWTVSREHSNGGVEVRTSDETTADPPHAEAYHRSASSRASVRPDDPPALRVRNELELETEYEDESVRVVAENRIGPPVTAVETRVVGGATVFEERWVR